MPLKCVNITTGMPSEARQKNNFGQEIQKESDFFNLLN